MFWFVFILVFLILLTLLESFYSRINIFTKKVNTRLISLMLIFPLLLFTGILRDEYYGYDALNYKNFYYEYFRDKSIEDVVIESHGIDSGFNLFTNRLAIITQESFWQYKAISYFIVLCFISYGIWKMSSNIAFAFFLFYTVGNFFSFYSLLRQAIACSIVFLSFKYLLNRKFWCYLSCLLLATTFHFTALANIVLYPLASSKLSKNQRTMLRISYLFGLCLVNSMFDYFVKFYAKQDYSSSIGIGGGGGGVKILVYYIVLISLIFVYTKCSNKIYSKELTKNNEVILAIIYFQLIALRLSILARLVWYISLFLIIAIPYLERKLNYKSRISFLFFVITLETTKFIYLLTIDNIYIPYVSVFGIIP